MNFDDLTDCSRYSSQENKQRINLSAFACEILESDRSVFESLTSIGGITSSFFCRIFLSYQPYADASIGAALQKEACAYRQTLSAVPDSPQKEELLQALLKHKEEQLKQSAYALTALKANQFQIRLNQAVIDCLASEEGQREAEYYENRIGRYLKAVLEEYCRLPYVRREACYYQDWIQKTELSIQAQKQMKLGIRNTTDPNRKTVRVKPYGIHQDYAQQYHYLVGMLSFDNGKTWQIGSVRFTSMQSCHQLQEHAFLSKADRAEIEEGIRLRGVQYLSSETGLQTIVVQFTEKGLQLYGRILNQRPMYTKDCGNGIMEFQCTPFQAENYFFRFGQDAVILKPSSLAETLRIRFENAAKQYQAKA